MKSEGNDDKILSIMTSNRELKNQPKCMFWSALHNDSLIQGDNDHPTPVFQHDSPTVDSNFLGWTHFKCGDSHGGVIPFCAMAITFPTISNALGRSLPKVTRNSFLSGHWEKERLNEFDAGERNLSDAHNIRVLFECDTRAVEDSIWPRHQSMFPFHQITRA